jgi:hypothetical protein
MSAADQQNQKPLNGPPPEAAQRVPQRRDVHVKGVPPEIWLRARQNALASGLPFKAYVTRLLAECQPIAHQPPH